MYETTRSPVDMIHTGKDLNHDQAGHLSVSYIPENFRFMIRIHERANEEISRDFFLQDGNAGNPSNSQKLGMFAFKVFYKMMLTVGLDYSIQPLGRVFNMDRLYEQALAPGEVDLRPELLKERKGVIIDKICRLMAPSKGNHSLRCQTLQFFHLF